MAKRRGYIAKHRMTLKECGQVTVDAIPSLSLIIVVIGGILGGVFTSASECNVPFFGFQKTARNLLTISKNDGYCYLHAAGNDCRYAIRFDG